MDEKLISKDSSSPRNSVVAIETLQGDADHHVEPDPEPMEEVRELLKLILPVTGTTVLEFLPGFVSILLAGNMGGPNTQHYVDAATISVMSLGLGLASALDTLCSQAYGAKRSDKIGIYFQTGVVVLSVALHTNVTYLTRDFSRLMLPGLPFLFLYELVRKVMQSQNIVKPLVAIAVIGNLVNLAAGYGLAYHTSLGFNGIAIARSLGNITLALLLVPYFMWQPQHLRQWWGHGWNIKAAKAKMACFLALAITLGVSMVFTALLYSLSDYIPRLFLDDDERKQKPAAIANVIGYYGGGIPLGAILAFAADMGVEGLWWGIGFGIAATWLSLTFMMLNYWRWDQLASEARQRTAQ
ncbi:hypothetical protein JG688_00009182 [Phytophthora aleatoria]|uniref:Uncharacterized protein n=1 Tax=Phytophthora aleatoria TaxID=2496075 RepID=A0A8J5IGM5_9STRA|nr:hypothetical protein JG688_00009182 [Phytophthora aleatoria]